MFLKRTKKKILVALSGGVDSSVAAYLLKKKGHDVYGGFIRGFNVDGCQDKDAEDARLVAEKIGIPFYVFNFEKEYEQKVVQYLLDGYKNGITPNPDVVCNTEIKFGLLYDAAMRLGVDMVASGHYARLRHGFRISNFEFRKKEGGNTYLCSAKDTNKDQTYFLWDIPRQKFGHIMFPLGNLLKPEVRRIAARAGLHTAHKKDSQGICFLGKFNFAEFLKEHIPMEPGEVIDTAGNIIGMHEGAALFTIGQRHGFANATGHELFVIAKDVVMNRIVVTSGDDPALITREVSVGMLNFLDASFEQRMKEKKDQEVLVRLRYRQPLRAATVNMTSDDAALIHFAAEEKLFPAEGQSAVMYDRKGKVLGGGIIQ